MLSRSGRGVPHRVSCGGSGVFLDRVALRALAATFCALIENKIAWFFVGFIWKPYDALQFSIAVRAFWILVIARFGDFDVVHIALSSTKSDKLIRSVFSV